MSAEATAKLSKNTKMAMISQFLGFMLDAYDMALVLVMAPILVNVFASPRGARHGSISLLSSPTRSLWLPGLSVRQSSAITPINWAAAASSC